MNYRKLLGRIVECCGTQAEFAQKLGMAEETLSKKLNNKQPWNQKDILKACDVLDIDPLEAGVYFFTLKVDKSQT